MLPQVLIEFWKPEQRISLHGKIARSCNLEAKSDNPNLQSSNFHGHFTENV